MVRLVYNQLGGEVMKFHLNSNIVEGTPEELVKYKELLEGKDEAVSASTDIQVGDRVKVLDSQRGAEGEATITKVLKDGDVELAGTSKDGTYLTTWSNHVSNLEKIEDAPMGYTFWYIDGGVLNHLNVLKTTLGRYFEDSKGRRYTYQAVHGLVKPIDKENAREKFEKARHGGKLLKYYPAVDLFAKE